MKLAFVINAIPEDRNYDLYNQKWAKAFIYFIHNTTLLTITKDMFDIEFTAKLTFEHIYPQNPKEDEWIKCSDENNSVIICCKPPLKAKV